MIRGSRVAVVVPAYQEAKHIAGVVRSIPCFVDYIVVVDDASSDDTSIRARSAAHRAQLVVVRQEQNTGVGRAIINGYKQALSLGADVIAVMAGDGQMDPDDLRAVLADASFTPTAEQRIRTTLARLNCIACHQRGELGGVPPGRNAIAPRPTEAHILSPRST